MKGHTPIGSQGQPIVNDDLRYDGLHHWPKEMQTRYAMEVNFVVEEQVFRVQNVISSACEMCQSLPY